MAGGRALVEVSAEARWRFRRRWGLVAFVDGGSAFNDQIDLLWGAGLGVRYDLGFAPVRLDEWRAGDAPFPSLRVDEGTILDLVAASADLSVLDAGRLDHICLVVDEDSVERVVRDPSFEVVDGPGPRFGARGIATSVYVRDPDGLVVELRCYPC